MKSSILDSIGNTPLVEIKRMNPNPGVKIYAKLEYFNPGGSIKDRAALSMIEEGEKSGELTSGKTVIEATSGNTGIGLALVCVAKGYKLLLTMSESASIERQKILRARGAEIVLTPGHLSTDGAIEEVYRMARENPEKYFMTDQYNNNANWKAHYGGTAVEIWEQTGGRLDKVVATMGTTGTLMGLSRRFNEYDSDISVVGVEPYLNHKIQGLKNMKESYTPEIYQKELLDEITNIDDEEAFETTRRLATEEGLFVGMSSGAAMAVAMREAEKMTTGTIVVIFPDGGERYLSTSLFTTRDKSQLKLFNTIKRSKETFVPNLPGKVNIYSCGPTANKRMTLGELRRYVFADQLCRYLEYNKFTVNHVVNITDLDDKTIEGSENEGVSLSEFTGKYIDLFKDDLNDLSVKSASKYPLVSEHAEDMVELAKRLVENGVAYEKLRSLYFNISAFDEYGNLSGVDLSKIRVGATVDLNDYEKDNPKDFTLLKMSRLSELKRGIYVKTEWGNVRPSLHLQCAAISMKYLGENFDIHTSSRELVFPHHENEVAISKAATGKDLANYWVHCDTVLVDGKKDVVHTLDDVFNQGFTKREVRFWMLSVHYRKPLTFSDERLLDAKRSLKKLDTCVHGLLNVESDISYPDLDQIIDEIKSGFVNGMDDDMNISAVMASMFRVVKKINGLVSEKQFGFSDSQKIIEAFKCIDSVLNIFDFDNKFSDPAVQYLLCERRKARLEGNWDSADKMREQLISHGISIHDRKI